MVKKNRGRKPAATPDIAETPGVPHSDPIQTSEAIALARAESVAPVQAPGDSGPSDGPSPSANPNGDIRFGNRAFKADTNKLGTRVLDILPDLPDIRDRIYQPRLVAPKPAIHPRIAFSIRDQGQQSSCTGHALAHVIDCLLYRDDQVPTPRCVSARMLYEMAKRNDEWSGTAYEGSSIRGALNGFFRNGVCSTELAPDDAVGEWVLTVEMAKEARETRLGAFYRLQPDLSDYHGALNEIGVIFASAQIHENWKQPVDGRIVIGGAPAGGHAFAIVGYDQSGFWVLNSWGESWGQGGIAHWLYEDWATTMMDAWVLQMGVQAPTAFSAVPRGMPAGAMTPQVSSSPNRSDIVGHFINIDDGRYITGGRYASPTPREMKETVGRLVDPKSNGGSGYDHLVIYAHGGLNTLDDEAKRIATWKRNDIFGRNGIYNFHLMWGSGFIDEAFGRLSDTQSGRAAGIIGDLFFETGVGKALGSAAWRNMKQDAAASFTKSPEYDGGMVGLEPLLKGLDKAKRRPKLHLVGHSAGAIMLGRLLGAFGRFGLSNLELGSVHLMAPACTTAFFEAQYGPYLTGHGERTLSDKIYLYNMRDALERVDTVGIGSLPGYGRSLLYLVSRAYEDEPNTHLAGMEIYAGDLSNPAKLSIDYAKSAKTMSTSHGGFDNDVATLTAIMSRIVGSAVKRPPTSDELTGY